MGRSGNKNKYIDNKKKKKIKIVTDITIEPGHEVIIPTGSHLTFHERNDNVENIVLPNATELEREMRTQLFNLCINKFIEVKIGPENVKKIIITVLKKYSEVNTKTLYELINEEKSASLSINTMEDFESYLSDVIKKFFDFHHKDFIRVHPEFQKLKLEIFKKGFCTFVQDRKDLTINKNMEAFKQYHFFNKIYELIYGKEHEKNKEAIDNIINIINNHYNKYKIEFLYKALIKLSEHIEIKLSEGNLFDALSVAVSFADFTYTDLIKEKKLIDKNRIGDIDNIKTEWQDVMLWSNAIIKNFKLFDGFVYLDHTIEFYKSYYYLSYKTTLFYAKLFLDKKYLPQIDTHLIYRHAKECKDNLLEIFRLFESNFQNCDSNYKNTALPGSIGDDLSISSSSIDSLSEYEVKIETYENPAYINNEIY